MIEDLLKIIQQSGWRLVSLSDMSVTGQPRWWCTLHRGLHECKFAEASSPLEALSHAIHSTTTLRSLSSPPQKTHVPINIEDLL